MREKFDWDWKEQSLTIAKTEDVEPLLDDIKMRKNNNFVGNSESRLVGRIPFTVLETWVTEAGLRFDDTEAVNDLVNKKLQSGEFNAFRVWEGRY